MSNPFIAPAQRALRPRAPAYGGPLAAVLCAALAGCAIPTHPDSNAGPSNPLNPAAVQLLDGTSWVLRSAQTSDGRPALAMPADKAQAPTLAFDTTSGQRRASGFAGCNRFSGPYTLRSGTLTLGPLATTRQRCGEDADRLERTYLDALANIGTTLVQMRAPQEIRIIATTGVTLTFAREAQ